MAIHLYVIYHLRWHREGMPLPITDASFGDMQSIHSVLTNEERDNFKPVAGNLKRGEASFHHPLTVHGSYANKSVSDNTATEHLLVDYRTTLKLKAVGTRVTVDPSVIKREQF